LLVGQIERKAGKEKRKGRRSKTSEGFGGPKVFEVQVIGSEESKEGAGRKVGFVWMLGLEIIHDLDDAFESDRVCKVHRTSSIDGPTVSVDPDDVNIRGTCGNSLFKDLEPFIDKGQHATPKDLIIRD